MGVTNDVVEDVIINVVNAVVDDVAIDDNVNDWMLSGFILWLMLRVIAIFVCYI